MVITRARLPAWCRQGHRTGPSGHRTGKAFMTGTAGQARLAAGQAAK